MYESRPRIQHASIALLLVLIIGAFSVISEAQNQQLTIYSGRTEAIVGPLFDRFTEDTGIRLLVRYGDTAELAATIMEEGRNARPDVFFAQDAGALGALADMGRLQTLPEASLNKVASHLRSPDGSWIGTSARARVVSYNTRYVSEDELPDSIWGFTDPEWKNRIGWAPTNGSFQAFVTALRLLEGEKRAEEWLRGILANRPISYHNNTAIVEAIGRGEVHVGFANHYYLFRFLSEHGDTFPVRNHYTTNDAGAIMNVSGVGLLYNSKQTELAMQFIDFLLSDAAQQFFVDTVFEYPVVLNSNVQPHPLLLPLEEIDTPNIDLSKLEDLEGTLNLLDKVGAL